MLNNGHFDSNGKMIMPTNPHDTIQALRAELAAAMAEIERVTNLAETMKQEASIHAQETRTANATIAEIYQAVTGSTGEPGNWNGAKPVLDFIAAARAEIERLKSVCESHYEVAMRNGHQLASRDLVIQQKDEALGKIAAFGRFADQRVAMEALSIQPSQEALDKFIAEAVAAEREECAKVCESLFASKQLCNSSAAAIRARKDK